MPRRARLRAAGIPLIRPHEAYLALADAPEARAAACRASFR